MQFVFKLGPLPGTPGPYAAYFVYPGRPGAQAFFAASDRAGLESVRAAYPGEAIECEPRLAATGQDMGMSEGEISPERRRMIGVMTLDLAMPGHFGAIASQELIDAFGRACAAFWQAAPWRLDSAQQGLRISFSGAVTQTTEAIIMGHSGAPFGLAMFPDGGSLAAIDLLYRQGTVDGGPSFSTLGVTFEPAADFAADGLRIAFGLERMPLPLRVIAGQKAQLRQDDLLSLAAALRAAAQLSDAAPRSMVRIELETVVVEARVEPAGA